MALTLVASGTASPTVGTALTLSTQTPSFATLFVLEVDTSNMLPGDATFLTVRKTGSSQKKGARNVGVGSATGGANAWLYPTAVAMAPLVLLSFTPTAFTGVPVTDGAGNAWNTILSVATATPSMFIQSTNPVPGVPPDWVNSPAYEGVGISGTAGGSLSAVLLATTLLGVDLAAQAYATANAQFGNSSTPSVTSAASIAAGDIVLGFVGCTSANVTVTPPAGWTTACYQGPNATGAIMFYVPGGSGAVTFNPTLGSSVTSRVAICAFPAAAKQGAIAAHAVYRHAQRQPIKESVPVPVNASEAVEFDLLQFGGTARTFPWKVWHL